MDEIRECKLHGFTKHGLRNDRGNQRWRCKKCEYEALKRRRLKIKQKLVDLHGGKCIKCGYNKCLRALCFHHRNPDEKKFSLTLNRQIKWSILVEEAKKCDLLCANCHMEIHNDGL